eukprot:gene10068-13528_t
MWKPIIALFVCGTILLDGQKFSVHKSYKDAKTRPPQYATEKKDYPVTDYLTPNQLHMLKKRNGDMQGSTFDKNWSGFKSPTRRILTEEWLLFTNNYDNDKNISQKYISWMGLCAIFVGLFYVFALVSTRQKKMDVESNNSKYDINDETNNNDNIYEMKENVFIRSVDNA